MDDALTAATEASLPPLPVCDGCGRPQKPPAEWTPPLDPAPVLAAHNKLTVLLMNAIEKDAAETKMVRLAPDPEHDGFLMELSDARWNDVRDALDELGKEVRKQR